MKIIIIIIKTSSTGPSKKYKFVFKFILTAQSPALWKTTTQESKKRVTASLNPSNTCCQTQCSEGHSTHESGPAGNTLQIGTYCSAYVKYTK